MWPRLPRPPRHTLASASSATVPTRKEKVAACAVPTVLPRRELIGACMPTRQPAVTPSTTASVRLMRCGRSLGLQPVGPDADVHGQRRVVLPDRAHLALDQIARLLRLAP